MNNYELLYILPSTMTGAEIKKTFVEIEKEIENFGGKKLQTLLDHPFLLKTEVSKEEAVELQDLPIIKKRLAYPIEKNRFGFYCLFNFSSEGKILQELNKYLLRNKNVLRHIIVQEDPMNIEQLKQLQKLFARKKAEGDKEEIAKKKEETKKEKVLTEIKKVPAPKEEAKEIKAGEDKKEVPAPKEDIKEIKAPLEVKEVQAPKEEEPKEEKKTTKTRKKKIKLEDLEEKLDEILEDTML
ncbi:30S ribosomal protein S6 [Patescibacteria group bacterium]|nr:30S ribosomal protein S6 [Patescibacteria group bacterium]